MKILIVDDEEISRDKVSNLLSEFGECTAAEEGSDALCLFGFAHGEGAHFDLVTMDIDMPGLRGQDVVKAIRRWESKRVELGADPGRVKIVMLTSMSDSHSIFVSYRHLCDDYIVKPITPEKIWSSLVKVGLISS